MGLLVNAMGPGANLFSSPPSSPRINEPLRRNPPPPPPPLTRKKPPTSPSPPPTPPRPPPKPPALRATHTRTRYYKPVPPSGGVIAADGHDRRVVVGQSGVSYLLPGAPFEFQFSYSEAPRARPLAIREPAFLPFGPPTMPRPWTGKAPLRSKKEKEVRRQRRVRLLDPLGGGEEGNGTAASVEAVGGGGRVMEMARAMPGLVQYPADGRSRVEVVGKPLTRAEVKALVKPHLSHNRQVNLGRDGLTHNMLELIHTHWRRQKVCKIRCRGVPTVDMNNVCHHLEEKTGGKIIYRIGGVVYLFRGRNYDPRARPRFPTMLWKPATPVYPKLIQEAPEGLTKAEADDLRMKGENLLPICKLAKNGIYINLVRNVRDAFEVSPLVKINCQGLHASDYKKIGAKLKELVPCVLLSFDQEQILIWRGKDWKSQSASSVLNNRSIISGTPNLGNPGPSNGTDAGSTNKPEISSPKILSLWKRAVESNKALLLDETVLSPNALLDKVEEFESRTQAAEHSYPALISLSEAEADISQAKDGPMVRINDGEEEDVVSMAGPCADDIGDSLGSLESSIPFGSLIVDSLAKYLNPE